MSALTLLVVAILIAYRRCLPVVLWIALSLVAFLRWPWRSIARALIWRAIYRPRR